MKITILYYHSIGDTPLSISKDTFHKQMKYLNDNKFKIVILKELNEIGNLDRNDKVVVITFDDCFMDVFHNALQVLNQFNFKATFFAVPSYDKVVRWGSEKFQKWSDNKSYDYNIPFHYMCSVQRKELIKQGMEIGAHSMTHLNLNEITLNNAKDEVVNSKEFLEKELSMPITSFCYPRGKYSPEIMDLVSDAGFKCAVTTRPGYYDVNNNFALLRFPAPKDLDYFKAIVTQEKMPLWIKIWKKISKI